MQSAEKCATFLIKQKHKTWFLEDPQLTLGQATYSYADSEKEIKYLGIMLNPWKGMCKALIQEIVNAAKCVKNLKLK